jgi:hypothetical protein
VTVPPWQDGSDASVLPQAYQDLLDVAADAGRALRAGEFAAAAGLAADKAKIEGLRPTSASTSASRRRRAAAGTHSPPGCRRTASIKRRPNGPAACTGRCAPQG